MASSACGPSGGDLCGISFARCVLDGLILFLNVTVGRAEIGSEIPWHATVLCTATARNTCDALF